jgi:integrase
MHAVDAYEVWQRERGLAGSSIARTRDHLRAILKLDGNGHRPLRWVTPKRAAEFYEAAQPNRAVDTHRNELGCAKAWGKYCVKQGWLTTNPFSGVEAIGRRKRGKLQLHATEARKLLDKCIEERSRESVAVALALLLGLRASEVAHRQVRDLDDGERLLWVPRGKTAAARRHLEVPEVLRPLLRELAGDRPGAAWLLGASDLDRPTRHWVLYNVGRLCDLAKVPVITAHGLRGTHASLATAAGATSHVVAGALGHASTSVTEAAYIAPQARADSTQRAAMKVIQGGRG